MAAEPTGIAGLTRVRAKAVTDDRGTVREFFRTSAHADAGIEASSPWAQINLTFTAHGAVRGLHGEQTDKLIGLAQGRAFGAWVDARRHSPTFGRVVTAELAVGDQMFVPAGVCNGFQAISEEGCQYLYCFSVEWTPDMAAVAVNPLDPDLAIPWPVRVDPADPSQLSAKDAAAPRLADL